MIKTEVLLHAQYIMDQMDLHHRAVNGSDHGKNMTDRSTLTFSLFYGTGKKEFINYPK